MRGFIILQNKDDKYNPPTSVSQNWKHWKTTWDLKTCQTCKSMHGKIWANWELPNPQPPLHPNCRCVIDPMKAVAVGVATKDGQSGADWWLRYYGKLPNYYITSQDLQALNRILWSNDGLMFVTYDHYRTFVEVP